MAPKRLLPEQDDLLRELVDAYNNAGDRPQVRVSLAGRAGSRVWLVGQVRPELPGKRKREDFAELRASGDLRQIKKDQSGTYYAITPAGLKRGEELARQKTVKGIASEPAKPKSGPPPAVLSTAPSRLERLRALAVEARDCLDAVLAVSSVVERFPDHAVITSDPWTWGPLSAEGQRLVGAARTALDRWLEAAAGAIRGTAPEREEDFSDDEGHLRCVVERSSRSQGPSAPDIDGARRQAHSALDRQLELIENLPSAHDAPAIVLVPDTNALIFNPAIDTWNVGPDRVILTVLPRVIAELDGKKMDPTIGEKAKGLIRRFKEYDRRGDTLVGVPLVGKVVFREVAEEPSFDGSPPWLSKRSADDRILAGALALAQRELRSRVVLVTRDRNMQNKARRLSLPYVDAEEF